MSEGGENEHAEECQHPDSDGDFLRWRLFLRRAKLLAAFKQRRVFQ
jgi:hypothetical protein